MRKIKKLSKLLCKIGFHKWVYTSTYKRGKKQSNLRFCKACFKRQIPIMDWYVGTQKWQDRDNKKEGKSKLD